MQVKKIKIQGSDNILRYAIKNQADLINDLELLDFISADMVAVVTLEDVNFYEVCRLAHVYRDKLIILGEASIGSIPDDYFSATFPGEFENTETGEYVKTSAIVKDACDRFMNIALQMESDEDIIPSWAGKLFVPMAYRRFSINVPLKFHEFVFALRNSKLQDIFQDMNYQDKIDGKLFSEDGEVVLQNLLIYFSKLITTEIDSERSSQLIKLFMFQSLGKNKGKNLFHYSPIALSKYNYMGGFVQRVRFFNADQKKIQSELSVLGSLKTPLKVDFAVQLPLHQLQLLERSFSSDDIAVDFISKPLEIIGHGIRFDDFIIPQNDEEVENSEELLSGHLAAISAYRERIKSASDNLIAASAVLTRCKINASVNVNCYGASGLVTLPPAIASTKAVITLDYSKRSKYMTVSDEFNKSMLDGMITSMSEITRSITSRQTSAGES